jgi:glutamate transport system permease protein
VDVILDNFDAYVGGMVDTIVLTLVSFALAFVVGTVVAGFRVSPVPPLRAAGTTYVNIVRNTPLAVLLYLYWFGLLPNFGSGYSRFWAGIVVLTAYTGTFVAEAVRAGINSVAVGQAEAGRSLGLTFPATLGQVIMPQAMRTVVQPLGSIFIALIKNSALVTLLSVPNLSKTGEDIGTESADFFASMIGVGIAYLVLTLPAGAAVGWIERKVAFRR